MENPLCWPAPVKTIKRAMDESRKAIENGICGASVYMMIYNALIEDGYLKNDQGTTSSNKKPIRRKKKQ